MTTTTQPASPRTSGHESALNALAARAGLPAEALRRLQRVLAAEPRVVQATLYGSRAMGNHRPGSDIDICLSAPQTRPEWPLCFRAPHRRPSASLEG